MEKGLGSDGLCHFPHPVGTEVTVSVANSMLLLTFDKDIYMTHLHDHITFTTYFGNIFPYLYIQIYFLGVSDAK